MKFIQHEQGEHEKSIQKGFFMIFPGLDSF